MKKLNKDKTSLKKAGFGLSNRILLAVAAGALTGLAVTYLLDSEKGRSLLSQAGNTIKNFAGNLKLPAALRA